MAGKKNSESQALQFAMLFGLYVLPLDCLYNINQNELHNLRNKIDLFIIFPMHR